MSEEEKEAQREALQKQLGGLLRQNRTPTGGVDELVTDIDRRESLIDDKRTSTSIDESPADNTLDAEVKEAEAHPPQDLTAHRAQTRALTLTMAEVKHIYVDEAKNAKEDLKEETTVLGKILEILKLPIEFAAKVCIPNLEDNEIDKWFVPLLPTTAIIASLLLTKSESV
jgi:hypothetical protein